MRSGWFSCWKTHRQDVARYATSERSIFFSLALQYLPTGPVTAVDVGCGVSDFVKQVQRKNPRAVMHCLDGNPETIETLRSQGCNAQIYRVPERLPFDDQQVGFVHCSHLIEHLQPQELYSLLGEFTRVLCTQGVLAISSPTLREEFYTDLSHVRPYPPTVLDTYLAIPVDGLSSTRKHIGQFRREALVYRYQKYPVFSKLGLRAESWPLDLIVLMLKKAATGIGIYRLATSGYTAVYRKLRSESYKMGYLVE